MSPQRRQGKARSRCALRACQVSDRPTAAAGCRIGLSPGRAMTAGPLVGPAVRLSRATAGGHALPR